MEMIPRHHELPSSPKAAGHAPVLVEAIQKLLLIARLLLKKHLCPQPSRAALVQDGIPHHSHDLIHWPMFSTKTNRIPTRLDQPDRHTSN
jgi:hypothetical protein